jgi:hypothetical protein
MDSATCDTGVAIGRESLLDVLDEIAPLIVAHWREVHPYQDLAINPNLALYEVAEARGMLRIFTARHDGKLIGYSMFFVLETPQIQGVLQAKHELLYVAPSERGLFSLHFIARCDEMLRAEGVKVVQQEVRPKLDFSPVLERLGYEKTSATYSRRLDRES